MSKTLEVYLSLGSPFAYLATTQLPGLVERTKCNIVYQVIDMYKVFELSGNPGSKDVLAKRKYLVKDILDWCKYYNVPFNMPSRLSINNGAAAAAAIAVEKSGKLSEFVARGFRAYMVEDLDIQDPKVLGKLAAEVGADGEAVAAAVTEPTVLQEVENRNKAAVERGVFGVPTFFIGDDMYWGNDRLVLVEKALSS
ncbi:MAG TPA: 2-hydroxychromene-2-carboxylate isomerase [Phormidium sp.]